MARQKAGIDMSGDRARSEMYERQHEGDGRQEGTQRQQRALERRAKKPRRRQGGAEAELEDLTRCREDFEMKHEKRLQEVPAT